jgi:hypothetical protein
LRKRSISVGQALEKEVDMRKLALGLVAAGVLVTAAAYPALAQVDVYVGPGGFSIGTPGYYPGYYYGSPYYGYHAYAPGYRYHPEWYRHHRHHWEDED